MTPKRRSPGASASPRSLEGGGEMGALMRSTDWSATPLGPAASWPPPLHTLLALCLASRVPMSIFAGRELALLYNDAFKAVLDSKHPAAFAQPYPACGPEIGDTLGPMLEDVFATGQPAWAEDMPLPLTREGHLEERYFTVDLTPIRLDNGKPCGVFCTLLETTASVLARADEREQSSLRESEQLYRALVEQAGEGIWLTELDGRIIEANDSACRMLGYSREELRNLKIGQLIHPDDISGRPVTLDELRVGKTLTVERRMRRKNGSYIHVEGTGRMLRDSRSLTITRDVTAQREAESALRRSEQDFRAMFELAGVGKVQVEPVSGRFLRVNRKMCEITGYSADELLALTTTAITHPDDRAVDRARFEKVLSGQAEFWESEKRYIRKDGALIWVHTAGTLVRDPAGAPLHTFAVILDITERKRLEAELTQRMAELAAADRQKDEFLAMLAHELRNPLGPVLNAVQVLERTGTHDDRSVRQRALITRQVRHMARLLDDLLDVSRITHGKIELRKEPLDLRTVIEQAAESSRPLIDSRGHALSVAMPDGPLLILADPTRMEQVIGNLLTNAVKYTPPGGRIAINAARSEGTAVVRVRDSGQGIPKEMLARVFDLFIQVDQSTDRSQGGLGIGLTMVKRLLELHGGVVAAHSEGPGFGTEVVVQLPLLLREDASAPDTEPGMPMSAPAPARVLVVDDNVDAAVTLGELLAIWGHEHAIAHDGPAGLAEARRFRPDIILLDIGLPSMDGYEVARQLRKEPELRGIKLIALTGYGQEQDRLRALAAGFDRHLTKPVDPEVLEAVVKGKEPAPG